LILPDPFLKRRHISSTTEYWLDEREGDLVHPCLPDARKLYIQPTTDCNLHCAPDIVGGMGWAAYRLVIWFVTQLQLLYYGR
jgi:hypothetical protein